MCLRLLKGQVFNRRSSGEYGYIYFYDAFGNFHLISNRDRICVYVDTLTMLSQPNSWENKVSERTEVNSLLLKVQLKKQASNLNVSNMIFYISSHLTLSLSIKSQSLYFMTITFQN